MENIVYNFAKITFQPKEVVLTENRTAPTFATTSSSAAATAATSINGTFNSISNSNNTFAWGLRPMSGSNQLCDNSSTKMSEDMQETTDTTSDEEESEDRLDAQLSRDEDNDDDSDCYSNNRFSHGRRTGVARRRMPPRSSKDAFNRVCSVIMKPNKKKRKELNTNLQTLKSIEKLYTNKRMKKFTPTNLETIFEEPSDENAADAEDDSEECGGISSQVRLVKFGARKLRRAISFSDGLNKNKTLVKKRRQKVKKAFGKYFTFKKISIDEFHERLNKSFDSAMTEDDDDSGGLGPQQTPSSSPAASQKPAVTVTMDDMQLPALACSVTLPNTL